MDYILKQFLLIVVTFGIVLWIQTNDDTKYNIKRKSFYDTYKIPILVSSIIGFLLNSDYFIKNNIINNTKNIINPLDNDTLNLSTLRVFTDLPHNF
jgi:hypothetical protein